MNVWAECYIVNESQEKTLTLSSGTVATYTWTNKQRTNRKVSFQAKTSLATTSNAKNMTLQQTTDGSNWSDVQTFSLKTSYNTYTSTSLSTNAVGIRFRVGGIYTRSVKNVTVGYGSFIDNPSLLSLSFGEVDACDVTVSKSFTVDWCNASALSASELSQYSVAIENNATTCTYGTATITVTYKHSAEGIHNETLTISDGISYSKNISLSGSSVKCSQSLSWDNEPIATDVVLGSNPTISATATSGLSVTYSSSNSLVLSVNPTTGELTPVAAGSATITASQSGDCAYSAATNITKDFTVSDLLTPTFWLDNDPDKIEKTIKVDDQVQIYLTNTTASLTSTYSTDDFDYSLSDNIITLTAKNRGLKSSYYAEFTLSQPAVAGVSRSADRTFRFHISRYPNDLDASISATGLHPDGTATITLGGTQNNVGTTITYSVKTQTLDPLNTVLNPADGTNVVVNAANTFTAKNAGTATVTVSQAGTYKYDPFTKDFDITVSKIANTLAVASTSMSMKVDDVRSPIYSDKNSDGAISTTSTDASVASFAVATNSLTANNAGAATVTISQAETYKYTGCSHDIAVSVSKYTPVVAWKQTEATLNEHITNPFTITANATTLDATSFTALDPTLADLQTNDIQTYYTAGTARFRLIRDEDRKYSALNETLNLVIAPAAENCDLLNAPTERSFSTAVWDFGGHKDTPLPLTYTNGLANQLIFEARKDAAGVDNFAVAYSTNNGGDWTILGQPGLSSDYQQFTYDNIPENITHVRFEAATGATLSKYYRNVRVTRQLYLTPSVTAIAMPTIVKDASSFETFEVKWSSCDASSVRLVSTNPKFQISQDGENFYDELTLSNSPYTYGSATIMVKYTSSVITGAMPDEGRIEIYNPSRHETVYLTGMTALEANLVWEQNFSYESEEDGSFSATETLISHVENDIQDDITSHYDLVYSLGDDSFASISGTTLSISGTGRTTITCTATPKSAYADTYASIVVSKTLFVHQYGTSCESNLLDEPDKISLGMYSGSRDYILSAGPADMLTFKMWKVTAATQKITVDIYSADNTKLLSKEFGVGSMSTSKPSSPNASIDLKGLSGTPYRLHFSGSGSLDKYVSDVYVTQQYYLETSPALSNIDEEVLIGQDFAMDITVAYSDIPLLQYAVSNNTGANLSLAPKLGAEPTMTCGDYGTFTFTLSGSWTTPASYSETITITDAVGTTILIPVSISVVNGDVYYLTPGGDWSVVSSWHKNAVDGPVATELPAISNPVVIVAPTSVDNEAYAYSMKITETGSLTINPTAGLTVGAGGITDESGNAITDASVITLAANTAGQTGYLRISPEATVAQPYATAQLFTKAFYSNHARWQYIGSPVTNTTVSNAQDLFYKCFLYGWDETNVSSVWASTGNYHKMQPFHGYATTTKQVAYEHGRTVSFDGQLNPIADQDCPITCTDAQAAEDKGWNLIANSWTSPIDVTGFSSADFPDGADMTLYVYNTGSSLEAQYGTADFDDKRATITSYGSEAGQYTTIATLSAGYLATYEQKIIPAMQGFFYVSNTNGTLHLDYDRLVWQADLEHNVNRPLRAPQRDMANNSLSDKEQELSSRIYMLLMGANDSTADHLYLLEKEDWTGGFDNGYDARKVLQEGLTSIFTTEKDGKMAVSASDAVAGTYVGIQTGADSVYTLRFAYLIGEPLYVRDMLTDSIFAVTEETKYTFSAAPNSLFDMRFRIEDSLPNADFGSDVATDWETTTTDASLWLNGSTLCVSGKGLFGLYDAAGRLVSSRYVDGALTFDTTTLPQGIYVARLGNSAQKIVR